MQLNFLNTREKQKVLEKLRERFGITQLPFMILKSGKDRLRIASSNLSFDDIKKLSQNANIESIGLYFGTLVENEIRLSIDATHLLKGQITKSITEISEKEKDDWLKGRDLPRKNKEKGFVIIKYKDDFLGTGKLSEEKIGNFLPKERRVKD